MSILTHLPFLFYFSVFFCFFHLQYNLVIDSGSSNFAIAASSCTGCNVSPEYTGSLTTTSISITYGSGSITGKTISNLAYTFGGLSASMTVMGITSQSTFFTCGNTAQGIMGIAFASLSQNSLPVTFDVLNAAGVPNGFALQLCAGLAGSSTASKSGNMWIGGYDSSFTSSAMQYINIVNDEWYVVTVSLPCHFFL